MEDKIIIFVEKDILDLVPQFLEHRRADIETLRMCLQKDDFEGISALGLNLKGAGGSHGLDEISEIGVALQGLAGQRDNEGIRREIERLAGYLERVEVRPVEETYRCKGCGKEFTSDSGVPVRGDYCPQCLVGKAEDHIPKAVPRKQKSKLKRTVSMIVMFCLIAAAAGVIAFQLPKIVDASKPNKPIRLGIQETDEKTDQCISNLWIVSRLMQEGKLNAEGLTCPASGRPYKMEGAGEDLEAICPNPELHGVRSLHVKNSIKVPEVGQ